MPPSSYQLKLDVFEGPLDLLLTLIEKRRLVINDISLASVADDFIEYVSGHKEFPVPEAAHFVLIASTLLLIKSKSLLPVLELTTEEVATIDDLEKRLSLYRYYRELSGMLRNVFGKSFLFSRDTNRRIEHPVFSPHAAITKEGILAAARRVFEDAPAEETALPKAMVKKVMSLEEMISTLAGRIQASMQLSFKEFAGLGKAEKVHVIVGFLAMLELVKQGVIAVEQQGRFSDIIMETDTIGTPKYA